MDKIIKIVIVEDDRLVADLLSDFLNTISDFEVVAVYYNGVSFLQKLPNLDQFHVLLLDLRLKDKNGEEIIKELRKQFDISFRIILLSSYYHANYLGYFFKVGVDAFIPKEIEKQHLIEVIRRVILSGSYFDTDQIEALRQQISVHRTKSPITTANSLSDRELDVLKLICAQYSTIEIAEKLYISKKTVEMHKSNLYVKTGAKNIAGLTIFASQHHLVNLKTIFIS